MVQSEPVPSPDQRSDLLGHRVVRLECRDAFSTAVARGLNLCACAPNWRLRVSTASLFGRELRLGIAEFGSASPASWRRIRTLVLSCAPRAVEGGRKDCILAQPHPATNPQTLNCGPIAASGEVVIRFAVTARGMLVTVNGDANSFFDLSGIDLASWAPVAMCWDSATHEIEID